MRRPSRKRRLKPAAKWLSTAALAASLAAWWFSANYNYGTDVGESENFFVEICGGYIFAQIFTPAEFHPVWLARPEKVDADWGWLLPSFERNSMFPKISESDPDWSYEALLPLWLPTALFSLTTVWLWKSSFRRIPPGYCNECGYDLTGNTSGVCSECGAPTPPTHAPPPSATV